MRLRILRVLEEPVPEGHILFFALTGALAEGAHYLLTGGGFHKPAGQLHPVHLQLVDDFQHGGYRTLDRHLEILIADAVVEGGNRHQVDFQSNPFEYLVAGPAAMHRHGAGGQLEAFDFIGGEPAADARQLFRH